MGVSAVGTTHAGDDLWIGYLQLCQKIGDPDEICSRDVGENNGASGGVHRFNKLAVEFFSAVLNLPRSVEHFVKNDVDLVPFIAKDRDQIFDTQGGKPRRLAKKRCISWLFP